MKQISKLCFGLALSASCIVPTFAIETNAINEQAKKLVEAGKYDEALQLELKAAQAQPKAASPHLGMTIIYLRKGNVDKAIEEAEIAVRLEPKSANAHYNLGSIYYTARRLPEAQAEYEKALALGKNDVNAQRGIAQCLIESGHIPEALSKLEALSKKYPKERDIWLNLGRAYWVYGDVPAASEAADKATQIDPNYYPALILQADIRLATAQFSEAHELANKAISINPHYPIAYLVLGQLASFNLEKPQDALAVVEMARKNVKGSPQIFFILGNGFARVASTKGVAQDPELSKKWWTAAELALKTAADGAPDRLEPNLTVAKLLVDRRRPVEALPYAKRAIDIAPQNPDAQKIYKAASAAKYDLIGNFLNWWNSLFAPKTVAPKTR